jgi:FkbM family methyltransferase
VNDIQKHLIQRTLLKTGLRIQKAAFYKFPYEALNYSELSDIKAPVIFDVGANIGQSSIWFKHSFPDAEIYAFEPFAAVYAQLCRNTENKNIHTRQIALGNQIRSLDVPLIADPLCQVGSVHPADADANGPLETIRLSTVDAFAESGALKTIHILKTDTEGFDINVIKGAVQMLESGNVWNVLTEATIDTNDCQHTNLYNIMNILRPYGLELYSLYDLNHNNKTGKLQYFNALFKMQRYLR